MLCLTLCDPMDYTVHGIPQARILKWVVFPFSRGSSQPRDRTQVSRGAHLFSCPTYWAWNPIYLLAVGCRTIYAIYLRMSSYLLMKKNSPAMANVCWYLLGAGRGQGCWPFIPSLSWPPHPYEESSILTSSPPASHIWKWKIKDFAQRNSRALAYDHQKVRSGFSEISGVGLGVSWKCLRKSSCRPYPHSTLISHIGRTAEPWLISVLGMDVKTQLLWLPREESSDMGFELGQLKPKWLTKMSVSTPAKRWQGCPPMSKLGCPFLWRNSCQSCLMKPESLHPVFQWNSFLKCHLQQNYSFPIDSTSI